MNHKFSSGTFLRWRGAFVFGLYVAALAWPGRANPTGGNVAAGSGAIAGQGTSKVTVSQTSNLAVINWQSFSINAGESTSFLQPSATSAALNRVLGGQTSLINGTLTANGQLYLINGNGIVVGPGGVINANAFTASTRDLSNADFLSGNLHFTGSNNAGVQNFGTINALGGNVALIGKTVDNQGTITAPKGTAGLVAGDDVLLAQKKTDGSTITVSPNPLATSASGKVGVHNSGTITAAAAELKAANGNIYSLAIQNQGIVRATAVNREGGHIWLTSDSGTVSNSGTLDASAKAAIGNGGTVTLKNMGGTTVHTGQISATGGTQSGNGGNVEISGKNVALGGAVTVAAPHGTMGTILLDPEDLTISASSGGLPNINPGAGEPSIPFSQGGTTSGDDYNVTPAQLAALNGDVDLQAARDLTVDSSFTNPAGSITLEAGRNLTINAPITSSTSDIILVAASTSSPTLYPNGVLSIQAALSANNVTLDAPTLNLNAGVTHSGTLSGTATTVNVGANGQVQNAVDASSATSTPTINLNAGTTYDLTSEVLIMKSLNLVGNETILDGQNSTRVMDIEATTSGITVNLSNLTLENGNGNSVIFSGDGGGLLVNASGNTTATVTITNSTITGNSGTGTTSIGGGILSQNVGGFVTLTINDSTISDNTVTGADSSGGGILSTQTGGSYALNINDSTISGNSAHNEGGGIMIQSGILNLTGKVTISNSTISGNTAAGGSGGGIENIGGIVIIGNTILAGNTATGGNADYDDSVQAGTLTDANNNLVALNGGTNLVNGVNGDIVTAGSIGLGTLQNNGGPTETMALLSGSPAIGAGVASDYAVDQRGDFRSPTAPSIGAYEYNTVNPFLITSTADPSGLQIGTLRTALDYANEFPALAPTITFNTNPTDGTNFATTQTITLNGNELQITSSLTLTGPTGGVTLDAKNASRVMEIDGNVAGDTINLSNLTITNGNGGGANQNGNGGGLTVYAESGNKATVGIINSTFTGNTLLSGVGGAIYNDGNNNGSAILTLSNSTIANNSGTYGGGISNSGQMTITNSTISGNSGSINSGAINNLGILMVGSSTISGNSSLGEGGGVLSTGTLTIDETLLAGNTVAGAESDYDNKSGLGTLTDNGYNLYGQNGNAGGFTGGGTGDLELSGAIGTVLAALGNYGGPTQTMALIVGSPAYLAGGPVGTVTADQRGNARGSTISIGAWDYNPTLLVGLFSPVVTTTADTANEVIGSANPVTLRNAIFYANAGAFGVDPTITFDPTVFATSQTITLDPGELIINSSMTITGPGAGLTIDAAKLSRVMEIDGTTAGITVGLSNLTLTNGNGDSGIGAAGSAYNGEGGGLLIFAENGKSANVTLTDCTITANTAANDGTGAANNSGGGLDGSYGAGGGIYSDGSNGGSVTLMLNNTTVSNNSATGGTTGSNWGLGGGIYNDGTNGGTSNLTIQGGSVVSGNTANGGDTGWGEGGGIFNDFGSTTITASTVSGNSAEGSADGGSSQGGGIYNHDGTVTLTGSTLTGNAVKNGGGHESGGGIYNDGLTLGANLTITSSTVSNNSATASLGSSAFGGGIDNDTGTLTITASTLSGNTTTGGDDAGFGAGNGTGGAIYIINNVDGTVKATITNSTFSGNTVTGGANNGAGGGNGLGGAIYNDGSGGLVVLTIASSTFSGNSAVGGAGGGTGTGGGIYNNGSQIPTTLTIGDTILAGNTDSSGEADYFSNHAFLSDQGYNLVYTAGIVGDNFSATGDQNLASTVALSSILSALANNGGPTKTIALVAGSPAIDLGDPALIGTMDQRAIVRGSSAAGTGTAADIGAYELAGIDVTADNQEITYGQSVPTLTYTVTSGPAGSLTGALALNTPETNAGTYTGDIGRGTLTAGGLYVLDFTAGTLKIDPKAITVMSNAGQGKIYGTNDPASAATAYSLAVGSSLVGGDSLTGDIGRVAGETVGNYAFTQGSLTVNDGNSGNNYTLTFDGTTNKFQISAASLTASIVNQSKVYGTSDPALGGIAVTLNGIVNATVTDLNGNHTALNDTGNVSTSLLGLMRTAGETVTNSPYAITGATFTKLAGSAIGNYTAPTTLTGSPTLTITPASLTASITSQSKIYGANDPSLGGITVSLGGIVDNSSISTWNGTVSINDTGNVSASLATLTRNTGETVTNSPYTITGATFNTLTGSASGNYNAPSFTGMPTLTITPASLTASIPDQMKVYGTNDPSLSGIHVNLSGVVDNSSISTWNGTMSVNDTGIVATTLASLTRNAGETVTNSPYNITGASFNTLTGSAAGNYDAPSFTGTPTLSITPASLTASIANQTKVYGANDPSLSGINVNLSGVVDNSSISTWNGTVSINDSGNVSTTLASLTRNAGETVTSSPYAITGETFNTLSGSASANYNAPTFTGTPTLTITPANLTASIANQTKVYGANDPSASDISVTLGGAIDNSSISTWNGTVSINDTGDVATSLTNLTRQPGQNVGSYNYTSATFAPLSGTASGNYDVPNSLSGAPLLSITPADLTVTADSTSKTYGQTITFAGTEFTSSGLQFGETIGTVTLTSEGAVATANVAGSPYATTAGSASGGTFNPSNYSINYVNGSLAVTPATLTYVADLATRYVGEPNPLFTGTVTGFVNSETLDSATTGTLTFATPATPASPVGRYAIDGSGLSANSGNYVFVQAPGNATALTIINNAPTINLGQPYTPFFHFSAQFNANANYIPFFVQTWFPLFDSLRNNVLVPLPPTYQPQWVYTFQTPEYDGKDKAPGRVITFGSSFTVNGQGGSH